MKNEFSQLPKSLVETLNLNNKSNYLSAKPKLVIDPSVI